MAQYEIIILVLISLIFIKLFFPSVISRYTGAPINISGTGAEPGDFFKLKESLQCAPGPGAKAAYYSRSDNAGGVCGDQQFVNDQMRKFNIMD
jgi:hypothetical protein